MSLSRTVLPNGLTVVSEQVPGVRSVALGAWVRTASVHEAREVMGVSHMLEHLCFKGTARRTARDIAATLESLGGSLDAYTAREHTAFQARVLDEHLPQAVDVMGDVMFHPALREEDLQLEKKVVLEEIAMVDDTPDDVVFELHNAALWGGHPYGYSILGTRETVTALDAATVRALHARAYVPANVVVAAAGNVAHPRLIDALLASGWGDLPSTPAPPDNRPTARGAEPRFSRIGRESSQTHLVFGSVTVAHGDRRRHPLVLVDTLLGGGMSSRLFQRIREELGLAYSVYSFQSFHRDAGSHGIYAGTAAATAEQAVAAIRDELGALATRGVSADELALCKQQVKGQITLSLEGVSSRMYRAAAAELLDERWMSLDDLLAEVDGVTLESANAACQEFFHPDRQAVVQLGPG